MNSHKHEMAWNEPKNGDKKNPWDQKSDTPDLEDWLKKIQEKIGGGGFSGSEDPNKAFSRWAIIIAIFIAIIYLISGFYIVQPQEEAVVLYLGQYHKTMMPGPHWIPRIIASAVVLDVQGIQNYAYHANMLTKDENIVDVAVAVQYRINNPEAYLFNVNNPLVSLQQATASTLRQVIGNTNLDSILTSGREQISQSVQQQLTDLLARYQVGIEVTQVALQPAKAPDAVKDAFDDAIKAQEDEQRYINQAEAYRMQVIPQANGKMQRILSNANAYEKQVVLNAEGETTRYLALLPQYQQNPTVTRQRLYLDALQNVMQNTTKVFVDQQKGNSNLFYLPLDKLMSTTKTSSTSGVKVPLLSSQDESTDQRPAQVSPTDDASGTAIQRDNNFSGYGQNQAESPYDFLSQGGR
jgi:modulator of FtsH protease HflK